MADVLLDQKLAARFLRLSVRTLERHRVAGTGPRYARLGRLIRYRQSDLDEWVARSLRKSTSESPPAHDVRKAREHGAEGVQSNNTLIPERAQ